MVARSPSKQRREIAAAVVPPRSHPTLLRETVKEVDKCVVRLQELQYTVAGGRKLISGTSVRFKQESLIKTENGNPRRSPSGFLPTNKEEWRRMSLPAMLLGETVGEILKATQFARDIVQATTSHDDPTTPEKMVRRKHNASTEHHRQLHERREREKQEHHRQLHDRRKREKQEGGTARSQSDTSLSSSSSQRAKSRIDFNKAESQTQICSSRYVANRVSPRNRPWARKTVVLFPNPLFHSSPVIARNRPTLQTLASTSLANKSQRAAALLRRSFSPSRLAKRLVSPLNIRSGDGDAPKMRRSFSPFKGRRSVQKDGAENFMIGLKHRPASS